MIKSIASSIIALSLIALTAVLYMQSTKAMKNQAVDGCMRAAQLQMKKDGATILTPDMYWYNLCMKEKGYK